MIRWLVGPLVAAAMGAAMAASDEELADQLEAWLEQPLDLRDATVEEMALLPWLGLKDAESVVGLREAGGLRTLHDLASIPGLDPDRIAALEPFVQLSAPGAGWGSGRVEVWQRRQPTGNARRSRASWIHPMARASMRWGDGQPLRGWLGMHWANGEIVAGDLVVDNGSNWSWSPSEARSRTGPVGTGSPARLRGGTGSHWRGIAVRERLGRWTVVTSLDESERIVGLAEAEAANEHRGGIAVVSSPEGPRWAGWLARGGRAAWRTEVVRDPRGQWRLAASGSWRSPGWRAGLSVSDAPLAAAEAFDPITGQALDRPHRAVQVHGTRRMDGWRIGLLARRVQRGPAGQEVVRERTECSVEGFQGGHRWEASLRLDTEPDAPPELVWSARWTERTGQGRRLRARWALRGGASRTLLAAGIQRGRPLQWQVWVAGAGGDGSSLWLTGSGGGPPLAQWLAPGGFAAVASVARPSPSGWTASAWVALEIDPEAGALPQGGLRIVATWPP